MPAPFFSISSSPTGHCGNLWRTLIGSNCIRLPLSRQRELDILRLPFRRPTPLLSILVWTNPFDVHLGSRDSWNIQSRGQAYRGGVSSRSDNSSVPDRSRSL